MVDYAYVRLPEDLGELVLSERKRQGVSQVELAKRSGTSQRLVSEFERGKSSVEFGKVLKILQALGLGIAAMPMREPADSRALVNNGIEHIERDLALEPRQPGKLVDYLKGSRA